tara:strand:+ start:37 stop:258 length:222 start_codon:yes stop_codon:yes gene_type:complete
MARSKEDQKKIDAAVKSGKLTKKQADKLSTGLLMGIIKKGDAKGGIKEKRKKMGSQAHKRGRPKSGSKVKVVE